MLGMLIHFLICKNISKEESVPTLFRSATLGIFKPGHAVRVNYLVTITLFHGSCITFSRVWAGRSWGERERKKGEEEKKSKWAKETGERTG